MSCEAGLQHEAKPERANSYIPWLIEITTCCIHTIVHTMSNCLGSL